MVINPIATISAEIFTISVNCRIRGITSPLQGPKNNVECRNSGGRITGIRVNSKNVRAIRDRAICVELERMSNYRDVELEGFYCMPFLADFVKFAF